MKKEAMLYDRLEDKSVQCRLCAHNCRIPDYKYGFCGVRKNEHGVLYTLVYGEVIASHVDPIEKKPLYHFFPGSLAYSIATIGCNFRCSFCQNWEISQLSKRESLFSEGYELKPEEVVREAKRNGCRGISYTYTEPTIFFEYAYDTAKIAKENGLYNNFVTNGYMSKDAIDKISPYLDACNIDLKSFRDDTYRNICHGRLEPVLDSIKYMKRLGIWVEITTLVVPGMNDSKTELRDIAEFITSVDCEIPWHISAFHPDYKWTDSASTPISTLHQAAFIGKKAGLSYIYLGNVAVAGNTYCPKCSTLLIRRMGYTIVNYNVDKGKCISCGRPIKGVWDR